MAYLDSAPDELEPMEGDKPPAPKMSPLAKLQQLATIPNLAIDNDVYTVSADDLGKMGQKVCRETKIDIDSRDEWEKRTKAGMDLALQNAKTKTFPWPNCANVRFPIMTSAAIQFAARAYPAIIPGPNVVRVQITGADKDGKKKARGDRIVAHMSWQLLKRMKEWEADVDRMLHAIPIMGCGFKKTYFDPDFGRPRSDYVSAFDLIVNHGARSLYTAPRVTHKFPLYPYQIQERILSGVFRSFEYGKSNTAGDDDDAPHVFLEQHRRWDLDGDGYAEPYIITVHEQSQSVCRVRANWDADSIRMIPGKIIGIDPVEYFTKIPFVPNPDGGFYDIGFGWLLSPLNESINTVINQLLDAGTLANTGGGFIGSGLRLKGGTIRFSPGEYKEVDVSGTTARDNVVPLTFPGPSPVLFQLLGLLIDAAREVASVKDVLTGEISAQTMQPGTALALIEQGLKVFTSIFKRIHRGLGEEYAKLYAINRRYFDRDEYDTFQDAPELTDTDYTGDPIDIVPVSDPSMVSDMQRIARAEYLERYKLQPGMNVMAITRRQLEAVGVENLSELFEQKQQPPPEALAELAKLSAEIEDIYSGIELNKARTMESIARAEAAEPGQQIEAYKAFYDAVLAMRKPQGEGGKPAGPMPEPPPMLGGPPQIPGRASGGPVKAGRPYRVGEEGEEVIVPTEDGVVIPHHVLGALKSRLGADWRDKIVPIPNHDPSQPPSFEEAGDKSVIPGGKLFKGLKTPGNINLFNRPSVPNKGKTSSVLSGSYNFNGLGEVLLPHVSDDGRILTPEQAIEQFKRTGRHLGIFDTSEAANAYAEALHLQQEGLHK